MNRWVDVAYRQACKKIAREKSERATFCIASITQWGELFFEIISYFSEKPVFFLFITEYVQRGEGRGESLEV